MAFRLAASRLGRVPRRAIAVAAGVLLLMALAIALSGSLFNSIDRLRASVAEANTVILTTARVLGTLQNAETCERGFLLTMRPSALEPYWPNNGDLDSELRDLETLTRNAPGMRSEEEALANEARRKMAELDNTIQIAIRDGPQAALPLMLKDASGDAMRAVREHVARINALATTVRDKRMGALLSHERKVLHGSLAAAVAGVLLLGIATLGLLSSRDKLVRAEEALRLQSNRLQATVDHIPEGVAVFDADDRLLLVNAIFFPVSGLPISLGEVDTPFAVFADAAKDWDPPVLNDPRPARLPVNGETRRGEAVLEVWRSLMPDGGQMLAVVDITRRSQAEAIARQAQKLEALGQLTGGVAHDFNNLLQIISANLELVSARVGSDDELRPRLDSAQTAVARGARLTRHLLAFARRQPLAPRAVDLGRLLNGMEDMLRRVLGSGVFVELVVSGGLWTVRADPQQLENALLNLCINARDAIDAKADPRNARITLEASNASLDSAYAAMTTDVTPGQYVMIAVSDTGTGMNETEIARAAEPFYTTKPEGKGTGLGLSMVYGFVKQSGGHFKIYSEPGHGTTVKIYLPRSHVASSPAIETAPGPDRASGELVLVVEDDAAVRAAAVETLRGLGYRTIEAEDGATALALLRAGHHPDLMFTDIVMPGPTSARELVAEAKGLNPGMAVVFTSGYTRNAMVHNGQIDPGVRLVPKPWRAQDLGREMRAALDAKRRPRPPSPPLRVLLVEDDALIRMTTAELLADLGHEVLAAATAEDALRVLPGGVDVLLTDIALPDMDGRQLVEKARTHQADLPVILASVHNLAGGNNDPTLFWLKKPYDEVMLAETLARARGGRARIA